MAFLQGSVGSSEPSYMSAEDGGLDVSSSLRGIVMTWLQGNVRRIHDFSKMIAYEGMYGAVHRLGTAKCIGSVNHIRRNEDMSRA